MAVSDPKSEPPTTTIIITTVFTDNKSVSVAWDEATTSSQTIESNDDCQVCKDIHSITTELFVVQLVFPVFTLMANGVTSVAIYKATELKSSLRLSLLNLSFTDILACLLYVYHITFSWTVFEVNLECRTRNALYVASVIVNLLTIGFMSFDRFLSIFMPFKYSRLNRQRHYVSVSIAIVWIISTVYVVVPFLFLRPNAEGCFYPRIMMQEVHLLYGAAGLSTVTTITLFNALIFVKARVEISKIASTLVGDQRQREIARMEVKASLTTVSIVLPYVLLNSPMYVLMIYFYLHDDFTKTIDALYAVNGLSSLSLANSFVNPAIYIWRCVPIRKELKKMAGLIFSLLPSNLRPATNQPQRGALETSLEARRRTSDNPTTPA